MQAVKFEPGSTEVGRTEALSGSLQGSVKQNDLENQELAYGMHNLLAGKVGVAAITVDLKRNGQVQDCKQELPAAAHDGH